MSVQLLACIITLIICVAGDVALILVVFWLVLKFGWRF